MCRAAISLQDRKGRYQEAVLVASYLGRLISLGKMDIVAQLLGFDWFTMQKYLGI